MVNKYSSSVNAENVMEFQKEGDKNLAQQK